MTECPAALGPVWMQHIIVRAFNRGRCSPHGSWEAECQKETRVHNPLQGHAPVTCTSHRCHLLNVPSLSEGAQGCSPSLSHVGLGACQTPTAAGRTCDLFCQSPPQCEQGRWRAPSCTAGSRRLIWHSLQSGFNKSRQPLQ